MERDVALQILKDNLVKAQERMRKLSDKHTTEREFIIGDMVYLMLQPYTQISAGGRRPQKISPLFFGPY